MRVYVLFCVVVLTVAQSTSVYYVDVNGSPGDCSINSPCGSISEAISSFSSNETSTTLLEIRIFSGVYSGDGNTNIMFPNVDLILAQQTNPVQIVCDSYDHFVFQANGTNIEISGISFLNCGFGFQLMNEQSLVNINSITMENISSGISAIGSGIIHNSTFINSTMESIHLENSNWTISDSSCINSYMCITYSSNNTESLLDIQNITTSNVTYAIESIGSTNLQVIHGNIIDGVTSITTDSSMQSVYLSDVYINTFEGSYFRTSVIYGDLTMIDCTILNSGNFMFYGKGVFENCEFENNSIQLEGNYIFDNLLFSESSGSITIGDASVVISNSTFINNAYQPIYLNDNQASLKIIESVFDSNYCIDSWISGIYGYDFSMLHIENCTFTNNTAMYGVIGLYTNSVVQTYLSNVIFDSNNSTYGSAIYCSHPTDIIYFESESSIVFENNINNDNNEPNNNCNTSYGSFLSLYINPNSNSSDCTINSPCNSIAAALEFKGNSADNFNIYLQDGDYPANGNTNITFSKPVSIISFNNINLYCDNSPGFISNYDFSIVGTGSNISLINCDIGVIFNGDNLQLQNLQILNGNLGVDFSGQELLIENSIIDNMITGISIINGDSISFNNMLISNCVNNSIYINSDSITNVDIKYMLLLNTAGIDITLGDTANSCNLQSVVLTNIHTSHSILLNNGDWNIRTFGIINATNGMEYTGIYENQNFACAGVNFNNTETSITIETNGNVSVSAIQVTDIPKGLNITGGKFVYLYFCDFTNVEYPLVVNLPGYIDMEHLHFIDCGRTFINSNGNNTVNDCHWKKGEGATLTNGNWNFYTSKFINLNYNDDGGAVSMYGDGTNNIKFDFDCNFINSNTPGKGGAIYLSNINTISVTGSSSISGCSADLGGAIYLEDGNLYMATINTINCTATNGGCVYTNGGNISMSNCDFSHCIASNGNGGAMYIDNESFSIDMLVRIDNNNATLYGGGIYFTGNNSYTANINATFNENSALNGAAISCCGNTTCNMNVELGYYAHFNDNYNSQSGGDDITCNIIEQPDNTNTNTNNGQNTDNDSSSIGIIIVVIVVIVVVQLFVYVICGVIGFIIYKKKYKPSYEEIN